MWSRKDLISEIAACLWQVITFQRGRPPAELVRAAGDLAALYEEVNNASLEELAEAIHGAAPDAGPQMIGEMLALLPLDSEHVPEVYSEIAAHADLIVPTFAIAADQEGAGLTITWEGGADAAGGPDPDDLRHNPHRWPGTEVQSLLFPVDGYSPAQAKNWAKQHGFRYGSVDTTANYHRLRQHDPDRRPCRTIPFGDSGIKAVVCSTARRNPPGGLQVLLLEDEPTQQVAAIRLIRGLLGDPRVIVADNVGAAIADLAVHDFKLIVSDMHVLGQQTGEDLFRFVAQNHPHLIDKFVFLTDDTDHAAEVHYRVLDKQGASADKLRRVLHAAPETAATAAARARRPATAATRTPATVVTVHATQRAAPAATTRAAGPVSPHELKEAVLQLLPTIKTERGEEGKPRGRYGHEKVFIAAIWRALERDPRFAGRITEPQFKRWLLAANRDGDLRLARADLVGAMDYEEVKASEIEDMGSTFHFVRDPQAEEAWRR